MPWSAAGALLSSPSARPAQTVNFYDSVAREGWSIFQVRYERVPNLRAGWDGLVGGYLFGAILWRVLRARIRAIADVQDQV